MPQTRFHWPEQQFTGASGPDLQMVFRLFAMVVGTGLCAAGATVAFLPGFGADGVFAFIKVLMGTALFVAGIVVARSGQQGDPCELHFDPDFGEFYLVSDDNELDQAKRFRAVGASRGYASATRFHLNSECRGSHMDVTFRGEAGEQISRRYSQFLSQS